MLGCPSRRNKLYWWVWELVVSTHRHRDDTFVSEYFNVNVMSVVR